MKGGHKCRILQNTRLFILTCIRFTCEVTQYYISRMRDVIQGNETLSASPNSSLKHNIQVSALNH